MSKDHRDLLKSSILSYTCICMYMQNSVKWLHGVIFMNSFILVKIVSCSFLHLIYFIENNSNLKDFIFVIFRKSVSPTKKKIGGGGGICSSYKFRPFQLRKIFILKVTILYQTHTFTYDIFLKIISGEGIFIQNFEIKIIFFL